MAATDNDALLKAMDQLMKEEDRASVIEYAKQLSTKGGDVVGTMRKMSQQGVDTKKDAAMWKKRALLTAAAAVVVCAVMFGLMVASAEVTKEIVMTPASAGSGRRLENGADPAPEDEYYMTNPDGTNVAQTGRAKGRAPLAEIGGGRRLLSVDQGEVTDIIRHKSDSGLSVNGRLLATNPEPDTVRSIVTAHRRFGEHVRMLLDADGRQAQEQTVVEKSEWDTADGGCYMCEKVRKTARRLDGTDDLPVFEIVTSFHRNGCPGISESRKLEDTVGPTGLLGYDVVDGEFNCKLRDGCGR